MGRRRRGRDIHGWLVVDKPVGPTSAALVSRVQYLINARKAGHAGTLDPLASGLLAIAFGEATKTVPAAQDGAKTYRFTARLGQATTTDDAEGEIVATSAARPTDADIHDALTRFEGETRQVPPLFSAVKHDGKRAYDLARRAAQGEAVDLPDLVARPLIMHDIRLVDRPDADHAVIEMRCGKGGYVRAVARDLGRVLGCHAHVRALRRLAGGPFTISDACDGAHLMRRDDDGRSGEACRGDAEPRDAALAATIMAALRPVAAGLRDLPAITLAPAEAEDLRLGRAVPVPQPERSAIAEGHGGWAADPKGLPVALVEMRGGAIHPTRVIAPLSDRSEA
ncbi:MAG: tRNA pseudouridine(55) synthase TruB [Pseudomonadota bacterium]